VRRAPHHYGREFGNYASEHLSTALQGFAFIEWDEANTLGLRALGHAVENGVVTLRDRPGFGLEIHDDVFARAVESNGLRLSLNRRTTAAERL